MQPEIRQVLRFIKIMRGQTEKRPLQGTGGLLMFLWSGKGTRGQRLNFTIAAAGPWCKWFDMKYLQQALSGLRKSVFSWMLPSAEPDPEELSSFTDVYGVLKLLISFQMKDDTLCSPNWLSDIEASLRLFSLTNAGIEIHFRLNFNQQISHQKFSGKFKAKILHLHPSPLIFDVSCPALLHRHVKTRTLCHGGHPIRGGNLPLSIPPQVMELGLLGDLSIDFVTLLHPCLLQYPNVPRELKHIEILVYTPSNIPISGTIGFLQTLPSSLDCEALGLPGLKCSAHKGQSYNAGAVYTTETEDWNKKVQEYSQAAVQQRLLLFLFLQHSDPFISHVSDFMAAEMLIERHLEDILKNNKQAMARELQSELEKTMKVQRCREKKQDKLYSANEVIINSTMTIISSSSNEEFRNTCMTLLQVPNTHELSIHLRNSLCCVTSGRVVPSAKCFPTQTREHPVHINPTMSEM